MALVVSEVDRQAQTMLPSLRMMANEQGHVLIAKSIGTMRRLVGKVILELIIQICIKLKQVVHLKELLVVWISWLLLLAVDDLSWPTTSITKDEIAGCDDQAHALIGEDMLVICDVVDQHGQESVMVLACAWEFLSQKAWMTSDL